MPVPMLIASLHCIVIIRRRCVMIRSLQGGCRVSWLALTIFFLHTDHSTADDWTVRVGGKTARHSLSSEYGPTAENLLWQGGWLVRHFSQLSLVIDHQSSIVWDGRDYDGQHLLRGLFHQAGYGKLSRHQESPLREIDGSPI